MPATKTQLTGGAFQDTEGNLLANGYLKMKLNQDENISGVGNVCAGVEITIQLDSAGNVASSASTPPAPNQYVWATDVMFPVNGFYKVTGYTAQGQPAWGPNNQQVVSGGTGGGTFNTSTWVPNSVFSWSPPLVGVPSLVNIQIASYQAQVADANNEVVMNVGSSCNFTIPADTFLIGTVLTISQYGPGQVTLVAGGGVTLNTPASLKTRVQFSTIAAMQILPNVWIVSGDLQ